MPDQEAHHPRGMSKWPSILACARYESAEGGSNAALGSKTHAYLANILSEYKLTGKVPKLDADAAFFDAGAYRAARTIIDCSVACGIRPEDLHIEERVTLEDGVFGTADCWYANEVTCCVWDFKTAYNPGRDYIPQVAGYALAIRQQMELAGVKHPPYEFNLRTIYGDSSAVDGVLFDIGELQHIYERVQRAFDDKDAAPTQCNWCPLCAKREGCAAYRAIAETVQTRQDLATAPTRWGEMSSVEHAQILTLAYDVKRWAEDVIAKGKETLIAGGAIADEQHGIAYTLKQTRGRKTPRVADACRMLSARGVEADAIRSVLTISASAVKALLKGVGITGKAADALVESVCDEGEPTWAIKRA